MLGADGTRHYLIAFMTPSESRGYDGLIGSYGLLTAEAGHISLTDLGHHHRRPRRPARRAAPR